MPHRNTLINTVHNNRSQKKICQARTSYVTGRFFCRRRRRRRAKTKKSRQRSTLPHSHPCSTIDAKELNFRVRDGIGCGLFAIITGKIVKKAIPMGHQGYTW